jgi:hypothetical protein
VERDAVGSEVDDAGALEAWLLIELELELLNDGALTGEGLLGAL